MKFTEKIRIAVQKFMVGRNGADRLSLMIMWVGIALLLVAMLTGSMIVNTIAFAVYVLAIFRIFSRNTAKRSAENQAYLKKKNQITASLNHRKNRFKMRKEYRYFKCPQCKSWLRVPRGKGKVKVTCGQCGNKFSYISK